MPEGTTLKAARKTLRRIEEQLDRGTYVSPKAVKTFNAVAEDWLDSRKHDIRSSTYDMYEGHLRNHFGMVDELKIHQITIRTVERFISKHREVGRNISTLKKSWELSAKLSGMQSGIGLSTITRLWMRSGPGGRTIQTKSKSSF